MLENNAEKIQTEVMLKKYLICHFLLTPGRRQSKTTILSTNVYQKSLGKEFLIAICCQIGDKWQVRTPFLSIFHPRSSIVKSVFDCHLPGILLKCCRVGLVGSITVFFFICKKYLKKNYLGIIIDTQIKGF